MPIQLVTGLPGNAKTLHTIGEVMKRAESESRPVYYHGIKDLNLDWEKCDPENWMDCPDGSIIVIDECQKVFRNRTLGSVPPKHVTELEEHRHRGMDFYIITQHPSLIDPALRRLVQTHKHLIRVMGMERSVVHKWNVCVDNPDRPASRKDSEKTQWAFDKSLYGVYKSAEVHTVRRSIPKAVWMLLSVPLILAACGYFVYALTVGKNKPVDAAGAPVATGSPAAGSSSAGPRFDEHPAGPRGAPGREEFDPMRDAQHYVWSNTPRVEGLAYTAPKYDQITVPVRAPIPAACVQIGTPQDEKAVRCKCYSQQGTPLDVKFNMCMEFARNGYFQDFDADGDRERSSQRVVSENVMEGRQRVGDQGQRSPGVPTVVVMANPPRDYPTLSGAPNGG